MQAGQGFFDKINNAFFTVIDAFLSVLEKRGWNIPKETRLLYHTAIFILILWLAFPLIITYFFQFEAIVVALALASFCAANIMPLRKLLGYYTSEDKIHTIVNKIKNNQVSIQEVASHLQKNLIQPNLTLSIIRAYRGKGAGIPPELLRAIIRQPQEMVLFREIIKEALNESDFALLMRKYRNTVPRKDLLETVKSQKMNALTVRSLLFYQENAYQTINEMRRKAEDPALAAFVAEEEQCYNRSMGKKNFLRQHHLALSLAAATAIALFPLAFLLGIEALAAAAFAVTWVAAFELFYNYLVKTAYFRV